MVVGLPVFWTGLLSRVSPEIGIVYIRKELHSVLCGAFPYFYSSFKVGVTAAVGIAVVVVRLVPYPYADIVYTVVGESPEDVLFISVIVVELHSGFLNGDYGRDIHAAYGLTAVYTAVEVGECN